MSRWRRQEGFSLIELAVSLSLFSVVIVSLSLMFDRALETGSQVRFDQVGKTLAQEKLEELRSLPYYVPWTDEARRVDLLDLYYPNTTGTPAIADTTAAYDSTAGVWTFTTTEGEDPAPALIRDGKTFTRATSVQFVRLLEDGTAEPQPPAAGYVSNVADADDPGWQAVKLTVNVSWISQSQDRSVSLDTLIQNIRQGVPNVEASGSVLAAQVSGVVFHDGQVLAEGVTAEVLAAVGEATTSFREVTGSESDATADPLDVVVKNPVNGVLLQPEQPPAPGGAAASSAPNTATGNTSSDSEFLAAGSVSSQSGVGAIAAWGSVSPSSSGDTQAQVSALHTLTPEGRARVDVTRFVVNSRDPADGPIVPLRMLELGNVTGTVVEQSTPNEVVVNASVDLTTIPGVGGLLDTPAVTIWANRLFATLPLYRGVVTISRMEVDVQARASATSGTSTVDWRVDGLRVWDPDALGYSPAYNFGFDSTCGGWEDDPATPVVEDPISSGPTDPVRCGATRVDTTKAATDNPNPVLIPQAYCKGPSGAKDCSETSLSIVAGVTVRDSDQDPTAGTATASVAQKNILSITTRKDLEGATPLEPMLVGVGDAGADASYITHEH